MPSKDDNIYSVIDLGTNTCLLLIARLHGYKLNTLFEAQEIPRIGKDLYETGRISAEAFYNVRKIFERYISISIEFNARSIFAFGTSAMRDALNSAEFIDFIESATGIRIRIISGYEEARYSYEGAVFDLNKDKKYAVLDIGGGSTEICSKDNGKISSVSFDIGSVRLFENFFRENLNSGGLKAAAKFIRENLSAYDPDSMKGSLVGVAGTLTTLASIRKGLKDFNEEEIHGSILKINEAESLLNQLIVMTSEDRMNIGSYMKGRSDIIISGTLILFEVMKYLSAEEIIVSAKGLRYGLLMNISDFNK